MFPLVLRVTRGCAFFRSKPLQADSKSMAASASKEFRSQNPKREDAASKRRPAEEVFKRLEAFSWPNRRHSASVNFVRTHGSSPSKREKRDNRGSLAILSPESHSKYSNWPTLRIAPPSYLKNSPPQICPSSPYPVPSQMTPRTGSF